MKSPLEEAQAALRELEENDVLASISDSDSDEETCVEKISEKDFNPQANSSLRTTSQTRALR